MAKDDGQMDYKEFNDKYCYSELIYNDTMKE